MFLVPLNAPDATIIGQECLYVSHSGDLRCPYSHLGNIVFCTIFSYGTVVVR